MVAFELIAAVVTTPAPEVRVVTVLRLVLIDLTLIALLWGMVLLPLLLGATACARLIAVWHARERGLRWSGLFGRTAGPRSYTEARPAAAWLWAGLLGAVMYISVASVVTHGAITYFKEPQLTSLLLSIVQLVLIAAIAGLTYLSGRALGRAGQRLHPRLGRLNPFGHLGASMIALLVVGGLLVRVLSAFVPQLDPLIPWRHILAAGVFLVGCQGASALLARRGRLLPADRRRRRRAIGASAAAAAILLPLTLVRVGADQEAKTVAMTGSPLLNSMVTFVRVVTDFDRDGFGFLLGENDCAPFNSKIHPLAREIPDNGIDENCSGRDFSFLSLPRYHKGEHSPVPKEFLRDWNILLLTIDTLRYDHTGFGGYIELRGRDTTPNLDRLVERSVSFTFANAPSAGTMASIPAILTSKFFHSGIALDEDVKPRMPPRLRPENLLISEILKERGYYNGAILTHQYFNDWGMEQGFDTYDNELGKEYAPFKVTSHDVTDKALAWIASASRRPKWFLWAHYLDPHGRYVAHPGERSFGTTEEDLYDGELYYTDKHVGRLLRELSRMPGADRTIVFITSDHGDAFGEHGFINHGQALYRELLHVPLIVHIPGLPPRTVDGAVSPIDILPTVCDLVGLDSRDYHFEGESLVPQIFYGKDAHDRVVFAETNFPRPIRAAITSRYKLIYKLKENLYEFYDLIADPWEQRNIYNQADKDALGQMKEYLNGWLERVYYARDPVANQAAAKLAADHLLDQPPSPQVRVEGVHFDDGRIQVAGVDVDKSSYQPGDPVHLAVYFAVTDRPSADFRLQIDGWLETPEGGRAAQRVASRLRSTADGLFPTSRWRPGEHIRDRFQLTIPASWTAGGQLHLGLRMVGADRRASLVSGGPTRPGDDAVALLATVPLQPAAKAPQAPQPAQAPAPQPAQAPAPQPAQAPAPQPAQAPAP